MSTRSTGAGIMIALLSAAAVRHLRPLRQVPARDRLDARVGRLPADRGRRPDPGRADRARPGRPVAPPARRSGTRSSRTAWWPSPCRSSPSSTPSSTSPSGWPCCWSTSGWCSSSPGSAWPLAGSRARRRWSGSCSRWSDWPWSSTCLPWGRTAVCGSTGSGSPGACSPPWGWRRTSCSPGTPATARCRRWSWPAAG